LDDQRRISILRCVSKIVERVVHNQLTRYLCLEDLLDNCQSGFRRNHSTTTALLKVLNDLKEAVNIGYVSFLLLLDFSKAFDKINHKILIKKLRTFNLSEAVISWFVSYLGSRSQCVKVGGVF
jgi:retron-type reverse transcriptase